jgi:hypothetical protein
LVWGPLSAVSRQLSPSSQSGVAISSSFLALAALGQTRSSHVGVPILAIVAGM